MLLAVLTIPIFVVGGIGGIIIAGVAVHTGVTSIVMCNG